ncbi:MAG: cell division protein ZapE [Alteromonadaceae bacterium]|jgi:cell division protein ZapE|uniref:Cell division protein ZapE n=1 Tax=Paraglaciecola mesophila KMM 241 TaxID=1128912 RepID=K6ZMK8_9ALTE|nr:cell division protein ZapE [Paraglaciecola mesophila]MAD15792.1 cell division protein ZapE [Alteromonadaceae bacterium]MBB20126.1 cell division protein ZapE [Rickettsiales bacterium]GAC24605.1 ATPase, AFG1 family protein [Paraglaciecola mesophila KMM 241]
MSASTPWQKYQSDLQRDDFHSDPAQANAVKQLQRLYDDLVAPDKDPSLWTKIKFVLGKDEKAQSIKGLYFWGGVGRGKTYLVDTFYDCLPFEKKMRVHFHRFMHRVHEELKSLGGQSDPLKIIAAKFASEAKVICFDEFFVSDITDAMILGTLMEEMFARGIVLVATSNIIPNELYRNGLQRARFLPAIALINQHTEVVNVDSGIDYRLRTLKQAEIYHFPLDQTANDNLSVYFTQLAPEECQHDDAITIKGRKIPTVHHAEGVAMFEFRALCDGPRSQTDYMELSRCYHSILLANVEQMGKSVDDIARRFIAMVDEFYERNVKLIMSAEVPLEELYTEGALNFEFHRCLSRLKEMQSHDYLATEHLP